MDDIRFLVDEKRVKSEEDLKKILDLFDDKKQRARYLSRFVRAIFLVASGKIKKVKTEVKPEVKPQPVFIKEKPRMKVVEKIVHVKDKFPLPKPPKPHEIIQGPARSEPLEKPAEKPKEYENSFQLVEGNMNLIFNVKISDNIYNLNETHIDNEILDKSEEIFKSWKKEEILNEKKVGKKIEKIFKKLKKEFKEGDVHTVQYYLIRNLGLGKVEPLLHDPDVTNITCENGKIFVERKVFGKLGTNISMEPEEIDDIIDKIADATKKEISEEMPILATEYLKFNVNATAGFGNIPSTFSIKRN